MRTPRPISGIATTSERKYQQTRLISVAPPPLNLQTPALGRFANLSQKAVNVIWKHLESTWNVMADCHNDWAKPPTAFALTKKTTYVS